MRKEAQSQKNVGQLLRESASPSLWPAEMCKRVLESSPWPMFVLDCESARVLEVNEAAVRKYGFSRDVLLACGVDKVVPPERHQALRATLSQGLHGPALDYDSEHLLVDGRRVAVEITSFPLSWNGRPARFSMARDSRKSAAPPPIPEAPSHPDPSPAPNASAGNPLAGTAAHDFNNLLTVILAVAEQMQGGLGDPGQQADLIARIVRNAQDLAHQRLLAGYQQQSRREQLHLNEVILDQTGALTAVLGDNIELKLNLDGGLWPIFADALQWNEVVLNLAMNARDAMPQGGVFHLATHCAPLANDDIELGLSRGRYVHLVAQDTGIGMSEETRIHAFSPYFSTKSRPRNSGLGLASVHGVVRQSGGGIRITSAPAQGARFDIFIPAHENTPAHAERKLILLVEDADELRNLIQDFLTSRGYEVISCGGADAAMQSARALTRSLDLVISDVLLPGITGEILVEQIRLQHPHARVVLMSGQERPSAPAAEYGVCLQKPFSLLQLETTVAHLLKVNAAE